MDDPALTLVGHHFRHHDEHAGYDQLAKYVNCRYIDISKILDSRKAFGVPLGPATRYVAELFVAGQRQAGGLVHFLYPESHLWLSPRAFRRSKIVVTLHHPLATYESCQPGMPQKWRAIVRQMTAGIEQADGIILLTNAEIDAFRARFPKATVAMIPHGFTPLPFTGKPPCEKSSFDIAVLGYNYRDWRKLGEIFHGSSDRPWNFHLVGCKKYLGNAFSNLSNVIIHPRLDGASYANLVASCDAHLLVLEKATANNALLEAHSLGVPTVASDLTAIRDYAVSSMRYAHTSTEFISQLSSLQLTKDAKFTLSERTKSESQQFQWYNVARDVERFYEQLLQNVV